ncbi:MAG: hypothetical protein HPY59_12675 [Anaerolineae bacterium]|nr:hypothetical protein [Anaerolineae bacterium]
MKKINWRYLLQQSSLILILCYLLLFASTHNGLVNETVLIISACLFTIIGGYWLVFGFPRRHPLEWPLMAFIGILVITTLTSIDPRRSLSELWLIGISVLLFLATGDFIRRGLLDLLVLKAIFIVGAIIMAFAWLEGIRWYVNWFQITGVLLPGINYRLPLPNFFGVLLNLLLMFAGAIFFFQKGWLSRILLLVFILSDLGLIYLTSSRGGWLGTAAGLLCLSGLLVSQYRDKLINFWLRMRKNKALVVSGATALVFFGAAVGVVLYRQALHPTHTSSIIGARSYLWIPAWQSFLRSPWVGEGPFTYVSQYVKVHSVPPHEIFVYAHNLYLDVLSGSGILGIVALAWLIVSTAVYLHKKLPLSARSEKGVVLGAISALAAFLVHGLLDSVHHTIPTSAWTLAILLGIVIRPGEKTKRFSILAILTWVGVIGLSWINIWQNAPFEKGVRAANLGQIGEASAYFEEASRRDSGMAIVWQQLGLADSQLVYEGQKGFLERAIRAFEIVVQIDPDWAVHHANLAALYREDGNLPKARLEFEKAVQKAPLSAVFLLNLGEVAEDQEDYASAKNYFQKTLDLRPDWAEAYYWRASAIRQEVVKAWKSKQPEVDQPSTLALEQQLTANPDVASSYISLAERYLEEGRAEEANSLLEKAQLTYIQSDEEYLELKWLQAASLAQRHEYAEAVKIGEDALNGIRYQGMYGPGSYGKTMYPALMFRRVSMAADWVPQVRMIGFTDAWGLRLNQLASWYAALGDLERSNQCTQELVARIPDFETIFQSGRRMP